MTMLGKLATPKGITIFLAIFSVLFVIAMSVGTWGLLRGYRTDDNVRSIAHRVVKLEQPSLAVRQKRLQAAIRDMTAKQRHILLVNLLRSTPRGASPEVDAILRDLASCRVQACR